MTRTVRELSLSSGDKLWFLVDWPSGHIEIIANVTVPLSDEDKATLGEALAAIVEAGIVRE